MVSVFLSNQIQSNYAISYFVVCGFFTFKSSARNKQTNWVGLLQGSPGNHFLQTEWSGSNWNLSEYWETEIVTICVCVCVWCVFFCVCVRVWVRESEKAQDKLTCAFRGYTVNNQSV